MEPVPAKDQKTACLKQHAEIVKPSGKRPNEMNWKTTSDHFIPMEQCIALTGNPKNHERRTVNIAFTNNEGQCLESIDVNIEDEVDLNKFEMEKIKCHVEVIMKESFRLRIADLIRDKLDPATQEPLTVDTTRELKCGHFVSLDTYTKIPSPKKCPLCRASLCCGSDSDADTEYYEN